MLVSKTSCHYYWAYFRRVFLSLCHRIFKENEMFPRKCSWACSEQSPHQNELILDSALPWAQPPELIISTEKGALHRHHCGPRDEHRRTQTIPKTHLSQILQGITIKEFLPEVLAVAFVCGWSSFSYFFILAPLPLSDKHPDTATTSSNCPGISIASSLHDLSTFNSNLILTVPKLQRSIMMLPHSWETQLNYLPEVKDHGCERADNSTLDHRDMLHYHYQFLLGSQQGVEHLLRLTERDCFQDRFQMHET